MTENNIGTIDFCDSLQKDYLEYAEYVIKHRAIADIRDGLKPVHRRILWAMWDGKYIHRNGYKKSARVVGDVIGKFHPHGDKAVYDALVRMAQDFCVPIPLIDGQGNFGNVDGDPPAAQRYTEITMSTFAEHVLFSDIDDDIVDFTPNYDGKEIEPTYLPARFPLILLTGNDGIASGMATSVLPYNLKEVGDAILGVLSNSKTTTKDILEIVPSPDVPLGGVIKTDNAEEIYESGWGSFHYRSLVDVEEDDRKCKSIVFKTIPYRMQKSKIVIEIAKLIREIKEFARKDKTGKYSKEEIQHLLNVVDLHDESSKEGIRIVVELKPKSNSDAIIEILYRRTKLQTTMKNNMIVISDGKPKTIGILDVIKSFIDFRRDIIRKRTESKKKKSELRKEILDAIIIAITNAKKTLKIIQEDDDPVEKFQKEYKFTVRQAEYVFNMPLRSFSKKDTGKHKKELKDIDDRIKELNSILSSDKKIDGIIKEETQEIIDKFGKERVTIVADDFDSIEIQDTIKHQDVAIVIMNDDTVKSIPVDLFESQRRKGQNLSSINNPEGVYPKFVITGNTQNDMMVITDMGNRYRLCIQDIPTVGTRKPKHISSYTSIGKDEVVVAMVPAIVGEGQCLVFLNENGMIKKMDNAVNGIKDSTKELYSVSNGKVVSAIVADESSDIMITSLSGLCLRMSLSNFSAVRSRASSGIKGMSLAAGDKSVSMGVANQGNLIVVTSDGYAKHISIEEFSTKGRGGKGVRCCKDGAKVVFARSIKSFDEEDGLSITTDSGKMVRIKLSDLSEGARIARGSKIKQVVAGEVVTAVSFE